MRISTSFMQQLSLNAMLDQQTKLAKTQRQASSGERLLAPADDPIGSARVLTLTANVATNDQYRRGIGTARNRLEVEDSALEGAGNALQRARELTVQAANGTLLPSDRQAIEKEARQLVDQMQGLANTQNANGEYLFSGYRSRTAPYRFDGGLIPPGFDYQGDANQRTLQIDDTRAIADGDAGFKVFEDIPSVGPWALSKARQTILGTADLSAGVAYAAPESFDITADDGTSVTATLPAGLYADADALAAGLDSAIAAAYAPGTQPISAQNQSGHIAFVSTNSGATAAKVSIGNASGTFLVDAGMRDPQASALSGDRQSALDALYTLANALAGKFEAPHGMVSGYADVSQGLDFSAGPVSFDLAVDGAAPVPVSVAAQNYTDSASLAQAINDGIAAAGLGDKALAQVKSGRLEFVSLSAGKDSSIAVSNAAGGLLGPAGFIDPQIGTGADLGKEPFGDAMKTALTDIDAGLQRISDVRAEVGARLDALDIQDNLHAKFNLDSKTELSQIRDLDYAEAISRFNLQQVALQAAQQAYAKLQNLSLFNYLR
jgi:flagellar hook-associated protein 3 FlgL